MASERKTIDLVTIVGLAMATAIMIGGVYFRGHRERTASATEQPPATAPNLSNQSAPTDRQHSKNSMAATAELKSDKEFLELMKKIANDGTGSIPGLSPDAKNPDNILHIDSNKRQRETKTTETFAVDPMWAISWNAVADYNLPELYFIHVEMFDATDREGKRPSVLVNKQWHRHTLPGMDKATNSDIAIIGQGGTFYLKITANVPYALDVRKPIDHGK